MRKMESSDDVRSPLYIWFGYISSLTFGSPTKLNNPCGCRCRSGSDAQKSMKSSSVKYFLFGLYTVSDTLPNRIWFVVP